MRHVIITGASKGFGKELAKQLIDPGLVLHLVARSDMTDFTREIQEKNGHAIAYQFDLSETSHIPILMEQIFLNIELKKADGIVLINNAGLLKPIGPVGKYPANEYLANLEVNFVAPIILTHQFVHKFQVIKAQKRVVMISSGAADKAYHGWSHYCSTKAGINRFMEVLALEQESEPHPIQVFAFNPGMMETAMQQEIRKQNKQNFRFVEKFVKAKESGIVGDPAGIGKKLKQVLWSSAFPTGKVVKVSDLS